MARLVGLYHCQRGAHTYFLKVGEVPRWGGYTVNLLHYEDASSLCMRVREGGGGASSLDGGRGAEGRGQGRREGREGAGGGGREGAGGGGRPGAGEGGGGEGRPGGSSRLCTCAAWQYMPGMPGKYSTEVHGTVLWYAVPVLWHAVLWYSVLWHAVI